MLKNKVVIYQAKNGKEPLVEWLDTLDKTTAQRIRRRISQLELGNFGDAASVGNGVYELRFFFGAGYRVYYAVKDKIIVILLCGGDKSTQSHDIEKAHQYWKGIKYENIS
jgi:putative addiction module killer protein